MAEIDEQIIKNITFSYQICSHRSRTLIYKSGIIEEIFAEEDEYHLFLGRRVSEIECEL